MMYQWLRELVSVTFLLAWSLTKVGFVLFVLMSGVLWFAYVMAHLFI